MSGDRTSAAVYAARFDPEDPLSALGVGEVERQATPDGWVEVSVRAASINHHDIWSLRGFGPPEDRMPMILGCDAAGVDDHGNEVIVHTLIGDPDWRGDETLDPTATLLSEFHPGTFASHVSVPRRNLVPKPPELTFEEAACLPTAWLTAYRMLFVKSGLRAGQTVLIQGAAGGVTSAATTLGAAAGLRVWATSRDEAKRAFAQELGAAATFSPGERLPERVDAVIETVGEATWKHSVRALKKGGRIVVAGGTSGLAPRAELNQVFLRQLEVVGSLMGTRDELEALTQMLVVTGVRPRIDRVLALSDAHEGFAAMLSGQIMGKVVLRRT